MQFSLTIEMDNAAFEDDPAAELQDILRDAGVAVVNGDRTGTCFDTNGNRVGTWAVTA